MKIFIVLAVCVAAALCAPSGEAQAELLKQPALIHHEEHDDRGQFSLRYVTNDGTVVQQSGRLVPTSDGLDVVLIYEGEYTFVGPDGKTYTTKYTSDIIGAHQAQGEHLPKAPEPESVPASAPARSPAKMA